MKQIRQRAGWLMSIFMLGAGSLGQAVSPQPEDFAACQRWQEAAFPPANNPETGLGIEVVFEDVPEGITRDRSWRGTPFQLGDKSYAHGLAFNATKHLRVCWGEPAERFRADIGLENNDDTRRGETLGDGSVRFHVLVGGQEVYASEIMRRTNGAVALDLDLAGAKELELRVDDAGDGRSWDQALWAEAEIWLPGGRRLRIKDLPLIDGVKRSPAPVSFQYAGQDSAGLLWDWERQTRLIPDPNGIRTEITWDDSKTGLRLVADSMRYRDFPAMEWVFYFTNTGPARTPLLADIQALDVILPPAVSAPATLHWAKGAVASFDDFAPQTTRLTPGTALTLQPGGGRSSSQVLPFFNLNGDTGGILCGIGWSGEWAAHFACDAQGRVRLRAGMERTRLALLPGESIRTPRIALLFYNGDRWQGQNLWRQFLLAHHRPTRGGKPLVAPVTCGNWGGTPAAVHLDNIAKIIREELPIDYYWIDAEWFGSGGWYPNAGNWAVKTSLYPAGFRPLSDALRQGGRELMLWFEPERVVKGTPWHRDHPEYLLDTGGQNTLFNLGNPAARKFVTDFISDRIREFGIGCYRQDFNLDPLPFWRAADGPDREGITEINYIVGLYAFWDELRERHPDLILDNCASGGRRLDLETLGRATPFWRTDGPRDPIAHQCHTYGLLPWVPLNATSQDRAGDDYEFRSSMSSALCLNWWVAGDVPAERIPANFPFDWARATLRDYLRIRDFYYGDYFPLTAYSQAAEAWMSYQLDRPDMDQGLVVVLRRPDSPYETARFPLRGLEPNAGYTITDLDSGATSQLTGRKLMEAGLPVRIMRRPGSALLRYERDVPIRK